MILFAEIFMKKEILEHRMFLAVVFELHTNAFGNIVFCFSFIHCNMNEGRALLYDLIDIINVSCIINYFNETFHPGAGCYYVRIADP